MKYVYYNLGLALMNGLLTFQNFSAERYDVALFTMFTCGFCVAGALYSLVLHRRRNSK